MIGTIRRHQTWLWAFLIAVMSVSLIVTFGPGQQRGNSGARGGGNFGYLAGKPISQAEFTDARKEIMLGYFLQNQQFPPESASAEIERQTYQRLFIISKENELGIHPGMQAIGELARHMLGSGSLDDFVDKALRPAGLTAYDFTRFLGHELGLEQLVKVAGMSGKLVTPQEAQTLYRLEHQDLDTSIVFFNATNYLNSVPVTPTDIAKFYTNQMANYRIPEQVQVQYVKFPLANYTSAAMATLTNLNQVVDNAVQGLGTNLYRNAKNPAESRENVKKEIVHRATVMEARKAALEFANVLDTLQPRNLESFNKLAVSNHLAVATTPLFDRQYGMTAELGVSPDFARKAFELTKEDPFAGPILPDEDHPADAVYVIALKDRADSRVPAFKEIEGKVTADYRYALATQMAQKEAMHFETVATNALAEGRSFNSACKEAGVTHESLPPFNLNTRSLPDYIETNVNFNLMKQYAFSTPIGKVSPAGPARGGAFVLYVNKVLPFDEAKMKQDFPAFIAYMRQARQEDAFNQWFNVQINHDPEFVQVLKQVTEQAQSHGGARRPRS